MKILWVDDEPMILKYLPYNFSCFDVVTADSVEAAMKLLDSDEGMDIQVVISDLNMPGQKGNDLLEALEEKRPEILRILASGFSSEIEGFDSSSAVQYQIKKPWDVDETVSFLKQLEKEIAH